MANIFSDDINDMVQTQLLLMFNKFKQIVSQTIHLTVHFDDDVSSSVHHNSDWGLDTYFNTCIWHTA